MTTETVNIFEQASRQKLRFNTDIGELSAEQLWDLPLSTPRTGKVTLDVIAVDLKKQLSGAEESFVNNPKRDAVLQLKFDIAKYIIDTRVQENEAKTAEAQRNTQRKKIDDIIALKEDDKLKGMSIEELKEARDAL